MAESPKGLNSAKLANTNARTSPSIGIYVTPAGGASMRIGAIKSFSKSISRNASRRFELDADTPGKTVEIIPGAISDISLTINRAMLYSSTMMEACGFGSIEDLVDQNTPFEIEERRKSPSGAEQIIHYTGCYFTSMPSTVDVEGDWQIIQNASIIVSNIEITNG